MLIECFRTVKKTRCCILIILLLYYSRDNKTTMKNIMLFLLKDCPYCHEALRWQKELSDENPDYKNIAIETVDEGERPDFAESFDYYFVPTYYVDGIKLHEGAATKEKIKKVLDEALK